MSWRRFKFGQLKIGFVLSMIFDIHLALSVPGISESCIKIKIKFLFSHFFWGTTKKCENKILTYFFLFVRNWDGKSLYAHSFLKNTYAYQWLRNINKKTSNYAKNSIRTHVISKIRQYISNTLCSEASVLT